MPKISLENNDSNNPGNINTMSNKIACMPLKRQNLLKFWFLATPKYAAKNGIKFPKGNVATIFTIGKSGCNIIIAAGNAAKKYREYRNPDISGSKYGRNATTRSETGTRDVPPAFGTNDAPALLFDRVDLKVTTTPSARDVDDDDEEEDKDKEDDEFARPPKDAAAIPEKATTGLFFFDLPLVKTNDVEGHSTRRHRKALAVVVVVVVVVVVFQPRFSCAPVLKAAAFAVVVVVVAAVVSSCCTMATGYYYSRGKVCPKMPKKGSFLIRRRFSSFSQVFLPCLGFRQLLFLLFRVPVCRGAAGPSSAPISNRILSPKALWEETLSCVSSNNRPRKGLSCCHRPRKKNVIIIATVSSS